ncbi:MAG: type II CRISPR RNA-guided endonuclease Cas9 [Algibacter sp.]|uniref:type II CRISPR RNA-guided endonuclease Cas9 n=1 Tax=Algibacter sp. TaxID=1872428 RepID=UPI002610A327|nr:type II CRISPR RNA-guided endonuclease Cas9 [Algibacter sp.]MDG1728293.1 type II CRISPR RNA-guided endonuclease Cas9 [Algibacter sp.]MDG2178251.1 type II CRISPR RNA-guided endonuclease Cas9 [Algibacter sp.]
MSKILGLDLGTNSIGWAIRDSNLGNKNQILHSGVLIFPQGVGEEKGVEFSLASERTKHRASRKLYRRRKWRKIDTLKILIENNMCPLTINELNVWGTYKKGKENKYPTEDEEFREWLKLNPYELRRKASEGTVSNNELGRALYHICERRGFKSGRKDADTGKDMEVYIKEKEERGDQTLGAYLNSQLEAGIEVRKTKYQADDQEVNSSRISYIEEFDVIVKKQNLDKDLTEKLFHAIFFQRPLKSQKGTIGKCTLEPTKPRCAVSHPLYEEFRMYQFLNSIKIKNTFGNDSQFHFLTEFPHYFEIVKRLFFRKSKPNFKFADISKAINKEAKKGNEHFECNYKDKYPIVGSPTLSQFINLLAAEDWEDCKTKIKNSYKLSNNKLTDELIDELWHTLFFAGDFVNDITSKKVKDFIRERYNVTEEQIETYEAINLKQGYASLSRKAIKNILPFLKEHIIYSHAVFFSNVEAIVGKDVWKSNNEFIQNTIIDIITCYKEDNLIADIVNGLVGDFIKEYDNAHLDYVLDETDKKNVEEKIISFYGTSKWNALSEAKKEKFQKEIETLFQKQLQKRRTGGYYLPKARLDEKIKDFLISEYKVTKEQAGKLYHPSAIDIYQDSLSGELESPFTTSVRNPMAMRTLYQLRKLVNTLLEEDKIDADTKIIIELARELNDKNKRLAIERYQREREAENKKYRTLLEPHAKKAKSNVTDLDIVKYRLWIEQNGKCLYTNETIGIADLFGSNPKFDIEHTFPRSKSFDNSLANKTLSEKKFNQIKGSKIPQELPANYLQNALHNIAHWKENIEALKEKIDIQNYYSAKASTVNDKNKAIQLRHYLRLQLDYWRDKHRRFTDEEIHFRFKNSQLVDTGVITKYAKLYLQTLFKDVFPAKGTMVSDVRKSWGLKEKDRNLHYHHAIDAIVLTCMTKDIREKLAASFLEAETLHKREKFLVEKPWDNFTEDVLDLQEDILVVHKHSDKLLEHTKRKLRKRGKIQPKVDFAKNEEGKYILDDKGKKIIKKYYYQKDKNDKLIPQKGKKLSQKECVNKIEGVDFFKLEINGSSINYEFVKNRNKDIVYKKEFLFEQGQGIRNSLHKDTFYGAIERENEKEEKEIWFVIRKPVDSSFSESDVKNIVDEGIKERIYKHGLKNIRTDEGFIVLPEEGNKKPMLIKRIRLKTRLNNLPKIKKQSHTSQKSKKPHKEYYYATLENIFAMAVYEAENSKGKKIIAHQTISAFDTAKHNQGNQNMEVPVEDNMIKNKGKSPEILLPLSYVLKVNQMVLFYEKSREELKQLNKKELSNRLYKITQFESEGNYARIQLKHHIQGGADKDLKKESSLDFERPAQKLRISLSNFKAAKENVDFKMSASGKIDFAK